MLRMQEQIIPDWHQEIETYISQNGSSFLIKLYTLHGPLAVIVAVRLKQSNLMNISFFKSIEPSSFIRKLFHYLYCNIVVSLKPDSSALLQGKDDAGLENNDLLTKMLRMTVIRKLPTFKELKK
mmetsp:Transcript_31694/g.30983  ORF Transcript_31694/g.30983 Transcript_31694/m.30983 type:complete len:124 (-) Transcript_31694:417-788(-)